MRGHGSVQRLHQKLADWCRLPWHLLDVVNELIYHLTRWSGKGYQAGIEDFEPRHWTHRVHSKVVSVTFHIIIRVCWIMVKVQRRRSQSFQHRQERPKRSKKPKLIYSQARTEPHSNLERLGRLNTVFASPNKIAFSNTGATLTLITPLECLDTCMCINMKCSNVSLARLETPLRGYHGAYTRGITSGQ